MADAVDDKDSRLAALEATVSRLQSTVEAQTTLINKLQATLDQVAANAVLNMGPYVSVQNDSRGPLITVSGANLQIVNGQDTEGTESVNGLGNLIVGYDEANSINNTNFQHCSNGNFKDQTLCESNGALWSNSHKSGSHNIVLGSENSYSSFGGLVGGNRNFVTKDYASVLSGFGNAASGDSSAVVGGNLNEAGSTRASVLGGNQNSANQLNSSIGGGVSVELDASYNFGTWAAGSLVEEP